jgi:hypothetical protein
MTAFMSLRVVRVSCQITQNAAVDAPLGAEVVLGVELPLGDELPLGAGLPVTAELPVGAALPQADSARAKAEVSERVASNPSRPVVRDVRFMFLVDERKASD